MSKCKALAVAGIGMGGVLVAVAACSAAFGQAAKPAASAAGMIDQGKKVYAANGCAACHTIAGKGGSAGPDLSTTGGDSQHTVAWFSVQVATPKKNNPSSAMPSFATSIKGVNMTALATYLSSLKGSAGATSAAAPPTGPGVPLPAPALVAKVEKAGGSVEPLAQNDNHLIVDYHLQGASITDSALVPLEGLKHVVELNLGKTSVTDVGAARLKTMTELSVLHLEGTKITDAGLADLKPLRNLTYLNVYGTAVTDEGLQSLAGMSKLKNLYVWQTKVTQAGVDKLKQALPHVEVVMGLEADTKAPDGAAKPADTKK